MHVKGVIFSKQLPIQKEKNTENRRENKEKIEIFKIIKIIKYFSFLELFTLLLEKFYEFLRINGSKMKGDQMKDSIF